MGSCWKIPAPEKLRVWYCTPSQQAQICPSSENLKDKSINEIILCQYCPPVTIWLIRCFSLHLQFTCYCVSTHQNRWTSWRREESVSSALTPKVFQKSFHQSFFLTNSIFWNFFPVWNFWTLFSPAPLHRFKHTAMLLTGSCSLADKSNELLLYFLHSIQIIHKKDMPITGFAGNIYKLSIVCIRKADGKYDVA